MNRRHHYFSDIVSWAVGTLSVWVIVSLLWMWTSPMPFVYSVTPIGYARASLVLIVPLILIFGLHELGHYVVAVDYCHYQTVKYKVRVAIPYLVFGFIYAFAIISFAAYWRIDIAHVLTNILGAIGIHLDRTTAAFIIDMGISLTPGGVYVAGRSKIRNCHGDVSFAGPLMNFVLGLVLWGYFGFAAPQLTVHMSLVHQWLVLTFYGTLIFGLMNALPLKTTDGWKVWMDGDSTSKLVDSGVVIGFVILLYLTFP